MLSSPPAAVPDHKLKGDAKVDFPTILETFQDLGLMQIVKGHINVTNKPKLPHQGQRFPGMLRFVEGLVARKALPDGYYFYTVFDGVREHSEPRSDQPIVNFSVEDAKEWQGKGTAGEGPRFMSNPPQKPKKWLVLPRPVLVFSRQVNDPGTILLPDSDWIDSRGYVSMLADVKRGDTVPFKDKIKKIIWRGGCNGKAYFAYDSTGKRNQRTLVVEAGRSLPAIVDASFSRNTSRQSMLQYKYQLDVDGEVNAWSGLFWKLASNSVVFKVQSHYEEWYYSRLLPFVHFIPVKGDASDLQAKFKWAEEHPEECRQMIQNAHLLISTLGYEQVLREFPICS